MTAALALAPPPLTYDEVLGEFQRAVVIDLGAERDARKRLAQIEDSNARTAKGHYEGKNLPGVVAFLRAAQQCPTLKAYVRRVLQMEADLDPAFERELHGLFAAYRDLMERKP
jgi:hypothetical protein